MTEWHEVPLGEVCELKRGYDLPSASRMPGTVPIVSSSGPSGLHNEAKVLAPGVVTGRYGTLGSVFYVDQDFWPLNTALYVRDFKGNHPRYVASLLESMHLAQYDGAAAVPGLNRNHLHTVPVKVAPKEQQVAIADILSTLDDLVENNRRRVEVLEEMARAVYREWFVHFRFPGDENVELVDSDLGRIPEGWSVRNVASIASGDRHAVTSGPFGSKLGRQDYRHEGVPVIRGANLRTGGGFKDSDFVFVSTEKAAELRGAWAHPGDVVVTQRGTLGQVGRIPARSRYLRYVLSQSQMKVTVDDRLVAQIFFYAQMSSAQTTQRFVAQAMTAGVPHVNLRLLREFLTLVPPRDLQERFAGTVLPLLDTALALDNESLKLAEARALLLPKLVTGQIDVSALDLDALVEGAVA